MAVTQPVATTPGVLEPSRAGRLARRFTIGVLFGMLLAIGALIAFTQSHAGRILPGVVLGGVPVGGLTESEARQALHASLGTIENGRIELVSGATSGVIPFVEVGRVLDDDGMLASAFAHGRDARTFDEALAGLNGLVRPMSLPIRIRYDRPSLAAKLAAFEELGRRPATDASVKVSHG